jgi:DNA adenine methylase
MPSLKEYSYKAPFVYFGGKRTIADMVWSRLGDVPNYCEPFAGSLAVLLKRPHAPQIETVNDLDCFLANAWRSMSWHPDETAAYACWPVSEIDMQARHRYLVCGPESADFCEAMRADPEYCNTKFAGWWLYGINIWIGGGWCAGAGTEQKTSARWGRRAGVEAAASARWERRAGVEAAASARWGRRAGDHGGACRRCHAVLSCALGAFSACAYLLWGLE